MKTNFKTADIEKITILEKNNTRIKLEIKGFLRSSNYKLQDTQINYDHDNYIISIDLITVQEQGSFGMQALVPFTKIVDIEIGELSDNSKKWTIKCGEKTIET